MAYAEAYASLEEFRDYVVDSGSADDEGDKRALLAASTWWDGKLRRPVGFNQTDSPQERTYYAHRGPKGYGSPWLDVDDIATLSGLTVTIDGTELDASYYEPYPLNALLEREPRPFELLLYKGGGGWPLDTAILVTATYGWPVRCPTLIRELTLEWAAIWQGKSPRARAQVNELDEVESVSPYHLSQVKRASQLYMRSRRAVPHLTGAALT